MRSAGIKLDEHMLYTIFVDALPLEYEVEARNLASRDGIGQADNIKAVRDRHRPHTGNNKKGPNAGHTKGSNPGHARCAGGGAGGGHGRGGSRD